MELAPKVLYSQDEAAELLGLCRSSILQLRRRGLLKTIRRGRLLMIHRDEIERFSKVQVDRIWPPKQPDQEGKLRTVHYRIEAQENSRQS